MKLKPPTAKMTDDACRLGFYVYTGSREKGTERQVVGAELHRNGDVARRGYIWVHMDDDHSWHYVENNSVTITNEPFKRKDKSMALRGKREGGRPSHLKLAGKKAAATEAKTQTAETPKAEAAAESGKSEGKSRAPQASFTRSGPGKQEPLPGLSTGERRSPEIEEAAERWEDTKLAKAKAVKAHQEADDILVTVMRKKKRTHYSRSTFGVVTVPEPSVHAKFVREKQESAKPKSRKK